MHPHPRQAAPVRLKVAVAVLPEALGHARPWLPDDQLPHLVAHGSATRVHHVRRHPGAGAGERARRDRDQGRAAQDPAADLGATGVVDDRHARATHLPKEPPPRIGVPWLARRAEHHQRREVVGARRLAAMRHQRADRGGADAQVRDLVALDHAPQPVRPGVVRSALEDAEGGAQHQRAGDGPRTHHPAHVREPEERVPALEVEAVREIDGGLEGEPGVHVHRALRAARGAGGVDDHERVVGIGSRRFQRFIRGRCHRRVPPDIALRAPGHVATRAPDHETALNRRRRGKRSVCGCLHRHRLATTREAVGGDEQRCLAVGEPAGDRIGAVAGEDRDVDRPQLAGGEHGNHRLGNHGEEDPDPVAPPHPEPRHGARRAIDRPAQLRAREVPHLAVLALPDERHLLGSGRGRLVDGHAHVVEAGSVEPARPLDPSAGVQDRARRRVEANADVPSRCLPEPAGIGHRARLKRLETVAAHRRQKPPQVAPLEVRGRGSPGRGVGIGPEDRTVHIARTPSRLRAITMRWISLVPSPISVSLASRR